MKTRKDVPRLLIGLLFTLALVLAGCGQAAAPTPTALPPTATVEVAAAPQPTTAAVAVLEAADISTEVDAFLSGLPENLYLITKVDELKELMATGNALLIDVREPNEYAEGHIPDAVNIPLRTLVQNLDKIPTDKPVVLSCRTGIRASYGTTVLHLLGYENVRSFTPSYKGWTEAGGEVSTGAMVAQVVASPRQVDPGMLEATDSFLSGLPENWHVIGKVEGLQEIMDAGNALLVDVREPSEYSEGRIPGAINIPLRTLTKNLDQLPKDRPVILSCRTGIRASFAMTALHLLGYENVRVFSPSFKGWQEAGLPIEGAAVQAPSADMSQEVMLKAVDEYLSSLPENYYAITKVEGLKEVLDAGNALLVDVREPSEYAEGHIPGAVNIPLRELAKNLDKIPTDRQVVLSCRTGVRCTFGLTSLQLLGFENVRTFVPSFNGWKEAGEEISAEAMAAEVVASPKQVDPAMLKAVDGFLAGLPENFYVVGQVDALKQIMDTGNVVVVDVREPKEYAEGHIPGAINIPVRELAKNLDKLPADKPVVVSCASGLRCTLATPALHLLGYTNVRTFPPSFNGWQAAGEPIEQ